MKKVALLLMIVILLSACSMTVDEILGRQPATPAPPPTSTPTTAPTLTPTVPSATFTSTPTLIGLKTKTPTANSTPTFLALTQPGVTLLPTVTAVTLLPQVSIPGFVSISVSDEVFYKSKKCAPASVKFTAQVADAAGVSFVTLFVRFKSRQTSVTSEWTSIEMHKEAMPGFFAHELFPLEMKAVDGFENAWVQYQLVATDPNSNQKGRTGIFDERLSLLNCDITQTPSPSETPTSLVP